MKVLLLLFVFSFLPTLLFSQTWRVMNPHPSPNTSYIGSAPSAERYITVTGQGEAIVTHDGGNTWEIVQIGGNGIYRSAFFLNQNLGWAVGSFMERLHKTTDGGLTWTHQPNAPDTTKYDVHFANANTGWTIGFRGFIAKTTNGGENWFSQSITSLTTSTLYGIFSVDENKVFAAGNANAFYRSTDGGNSWASIPAIFGTSTDFRSIYFTSSQTGYVVGSRNRIAKTTDGGSTWFSVLDGGTTNQLWTISFNSAGTIGLATGGDGLVFRSSDSGNTWSPVGSFPDITFYSVRFGSDNVAYLSGSSGYMYKSTDSGATWNIVGYRFTSTRIKDVSFANNNVGYVVGTNFLAKTTDGGFTWQEFVSPFTGDINEVVAPSPDLAIAGADGGNVVRTTDGGLTWSVIPTGINGTNSDILAIDFINTTTGIAAGYNGTIAKSNDGGATWSIAGTITGSNPWDMDMVDSEYAWVVGTGEKIFRTTDSGANWTEQFSMGGLGTYGVSFIDRNNGVAGGTGGNTYYTSNGGTTWTSAVTPPDRTVWGMHIASSPVYGSVAMAACASGYVFTSTDGGRNWIEEPRFAINTMDDVYMTDAANAWFVGSSGLILKYTNQGNVPVELNSFNFFLSDNSVTLSWITSSEANNKGFNIERLSEETSEWNNIGFVKGSGSSSEINSYSFTDENLLPGKYQYRLNQINFDGSSKFYDLGEIVEIGIPAEFSLSQNYPNPFNPKTTISFSLAAKEFISLKVFDILGKEVAELISEVKEAGNYKIEFDASELTSGIYFYSLNAGNFSSTKKLILMK